MSKPPQSSIRKLGARTDEQGRPLVDFTIDGPRNSGPKTRSMPPAFFLIAQMLDGGNGLRVRMKDNGSPEAPIFRMYLIADKAPASAEGPEVDLRGFETPLARILYGVPAGADLREAYLSDYRTIRPEAFVLAKARRDPPPTREDLLAYVRHREGEKPEAKLRKLFADADREHRAELRALGVWR